MDYFRHEFPRRSISGLTSIYCRKCGREICRTPQAQFRTVSKCAICQLEEQGVKNPEDYVLQPYLQTDPTKPPIPRDADDPEYLYQLFPDERTEPGQPVSPTGVMGTVRAIYKVLGFGKDQKEREADARAVPDSRKVANRQKKSTLYD